MKDVVLDTNFLLLPHTHKIDVYAEIEKIIPEEHRLIVLSGSIMELEKLSKGTSASAVGARVGLQLLAGKNIAEIPSQGGVDEAILDYARKHGKTIVATCDKQLGKKLREAGTETITKRGENTLMRF
ncbi:MAG: PIN domain-containing protein [Candidatus Altiarchaeota archaeon]